MTYLGSSLNNGGKPGEDWLRWAMLQHLGLLAFVVPAIVLILGAWAIVSTRQSRDTRRGEGLAAAGMALAFVSLVLLLLWMLPWRSS
jgi:hypothetical protein